MELEYCDTEGKRINEAGNYCNSQTDHRKLTFTPNIVGILSPTSGPNHFRAASVQGPHATINASASMIVPSSSLTPHTAPVLSNIASMTFPITSVDPTDC